MESDLVPFSRSALAKFSPSMTLAWTASVLMVAPAAVMPSLLAAKTVKGPSPLMPAALKASAYCEICSSPDTAADTSLAAELEADVPSSLPPHATRAPVESSSASARIATSQVRDFFI